METNYEKKIIELGLFYYNIYKISRNIYFFAKRKKSKIYSKSWNYKKNNYCK